MRRTSRERYSALLVGLVYLLVFTAAWARFGTVALLPALATLLTLLLLFGFYCIHKIRGDIRDGTSQLQSVLDIRAAVRADLPLPPFGSPMIEADCGSVIVRHILMYRPELIVEAGSGSSTVLAACCLKQIGAGKVVALEHLKPGLSSTSRIYNRWASPSTDVCATPRLSASNATGSNTSGSQRAHSSSTARSTCSSWTAPVRWSRGAAVAVPGAPAAGQASQRPSSLSGLTRDTR